MNPRQVPVEDLLEGIVKTFTAPVFIIDEDGTFVEAFANERTKELLYADPVDFIGNNLHEVFPEERAIEFHTVIEQTLETGTMHDYEYQLPTKSGTRHFSSHVSPMPGNPEERVIWIAEDITKRVELREAYQRQYQHLARAEGLANIGGWEYIPSDESVVWTEGLYDIFEVSEDHTPSLQSGLDFFVPPDRSRLEAAFEECLKSGMTYSLNVRIVTDEGRQRLVNVRGERVTMQGETRLMGVVQDITEQKLDEQRLMVLNRVLRHNLRNQLNTIMGYAELLEDELSEETQEIFANIEKSAESLLSLAEKSRRFNQVVEYDYTSEAVVLNRVIEEVCASCRESFPEATIKSDCSAVTVSANEMAIRFMTEELVGNALRYAKTETPHVTVTVSSQGTNQVAITIADNGPGLPDQEKAVLRHGEETQLLHSDGMGLWTVNWLVTKLSGGVSVAENSPQGTIITITLPIDWGRI